MTAVSVGAISATRGPIALTLGTREVSAGEKLGADPTYFIALATLV